MELLSVWRLLARARLRVLAGAVLAVALGLMVAGVLPPGGSGSGAPSTGLARERVFVDAPTSLVADVGASANTLGAEAALLSDLLAADPQVRAIERAAGVPAGRLMILRPAETAPTVPSPLGAATSLVASAPAKYAVTIDVAADLPIVTLEAVAPTRDGARRLTTATASELSALAAARAPAAYRRLAVRTFEPVRAITVPSGGGAKRVALAVGATIFLFFAWCGAIVIFTGLRRAWRAIPYQYGAAG